MKVVISESGRTELNRLELDIMKAINRIVAHVSQRYILGLSHILVTDLPFDKKSRRDKAMGSYFARERNHPAHIEIYLKNLFGHIKSGESFREMLPIQEFGLAKVIYHEFGHHIMHIASHGIRKPKRERFAESYAKQITGNYVLDNAKSINACFDYLESIAESRSVSLDTISKMRAGWEQTYQGAIENKVDDP